MKKPLAFNYADYLAVKEKLGYYEKAERDGLLVVDKDGILNAVKKSILVNSDEKKYRYELGKDCLIPCCQSIWQVSWR